MATITTQNLPGPRQESFLSSFARGLQERQEQEKASTKRQFELMAQMGMLELANEGEEGAVKWGNQWVKPKQKDTSEQRLREAQIIQTLSKADGTDKGYGLFKTAVGAGFSPEQAVEFLKIYQTQQNPQDLQDTGTGKGDEDKKKSRAHGAGEILGNLPATALGINPFLAQSLKAMWRGVIGSEDPVQIQPPWEHGKMQVGQGMRQGKDAIGSIFEMIKKNNERGTMEQERIRGGGQPTYLPPSGGGF